MRSPAAEYALRCEEKASTSHGRSPCQKSTTVKIVHWGRLGIDLGHVVSREFFKFFDRLARPAVVGLVLTSPSDKKIALASVFRLQSP
jgi:hypothetical protein